LLYTAIVVGAILPQTRYEKCKAREGGRRARSDATPMEVTPKFIVFAQPSTAAQKQTCDIDALGHQPT
jgi:hypothetical protein